MVLFAMFSILILSGCVNNRQTQTQTISTENKSITSEYINKVSDTDIVYVNHIYESPANIFNDYRKIINQRLEEFLNNRSIAVVKIDRNYYPDKQIESVDVYYINKK